MITRVSQINNHCKLAFEARYGVYGTSQELELATRLIQENNLKRGLPGELTSWIK